MLIKGVPEFTLFNGVPTFFPTACAIFSCLKSRDAAQDLGPVPHRHGQDPRVEMIHREHGAGVAWDIIRHLVNFADVIQTGRAELI